MFDDNRFGKGLLLNVGYCLLRRESLQEVSFTPGCLFAFCLDHRGEKSGIDPIRQFRADKTLVQFNHLLHLGSLFCQRAEFGVHLEKRCLRGLQFMICFVVCHARLRFLLVAQPANWRRFCRRFFLRSARWLASSTRSWIWCSGCCLIQRSGNNVSRSE